MRRLSSIVASFCLCGIVGCATKATDVHVTRPLVGLWSEHSENVESLTLRKSDGTYVQKKIQRYDSAKPAIRYVQKGFWKVNGNRYKFGIDDVSAQMWKNYVGKVWEVEVLEITNTSFRYVSTDGAIVEEKRIGEASDGAFERAKLSELSEQ